MLALTSFSRKIWLTSSPGENLILSASTSPPNLTFGHTDCTLPPPSSPTPILPHKISSTFTLSFPKNFSTLRTLRHCSFSVTKALKSSTSSSLPVKTQYFSAIVKSWCSSPTLALILSVPNGVPCKMDVTFAGELDLSPTTTVLTSSIFATIWGLSHSRCSGKLCALDIRNLNDEN